MPPTLTANATNSEHSAAHAAELGDSLAAAMNEHFRMIWVAGGTAADRSAILGTLADVKKCPFLDVGKRLSAAMIEIPSSLRAAAAENAFFDMLLSGGGNVLCLDHLEILFEVSLMLNPIELVKNYSRRFLLVASWPGSLSSDALIYGPEDHPAHVKILRRDLECVIHTI